MLKLSRFLIIACILHIILGFFHYSIFPQILCMGMTRMLEENAFGNGWQIISNFLLIPLEVSVSMIFLLLICETERVIYKRNDVF